MKFGQPGKSPAQQAMQRAQTQMQQQRMRNLQGGYYYQQMTRKNEMLRQRALKRSAPLQGRLPSALPGLRGQASRPAQPNQPWKRQPANLDQPQPLLKPSAFIDKASTPRPVERSSQRSSALKNWLNAMRAGKQK